MTVEGGVRYVIWPPWYSTTNNIANFDPRFYDPAVEAVDQPSTGRIVGGAALQRHRPGRATASRATGNDLAVASDPQVQALFRGEPRGFSKTHYNVFEPRLGMSYSLNPKTILASAPACSTTASR